MPPSSHDDPHAAVSDGRSSIDNQTELRRSLRTVFRAMLGRDPDVRTLENITASFGSGNSPAVQLVVHVWHSPEFRKNLSVLAPAVAPAFIHGARVQMIESLLPAAARILDLGGANSPLYEMGYPYEFERYVMVDLPSEQRCDQYRDVKNVLPDRAFVHYGDMADLSEFMDESFDLVWSGESIEHISMDSAVRMLSEVQRVLARDGHFCLDTPNRLVTRVQMAAAGGGFIHPEHKHEYAPDELRSLLEHAGFSIERAKGLCAMPTVASCQKFDVADFVRGQAISDDLDNAYIQFFDCVKGSRSPQRPERPPNAAAQSGDRR